MKNEKKKSCCNYPILSNKIIFDPEINHSFCKNCGNILLKTSSGNIHYTIKPKNKKKDRNRTYKNNKRYEEKNRRRFSFSK